MSGHMSFVEQVTEVGGGLSGCGDAWRWGSLDVSSVRCNKFSVVELLRTSMLHLSSVYNCIKHHIPSWLISSGLCSFYLWVSVVVTGELSAAQQLI